MPRSNGETFTGLRPRGSDGMGEAFLVQHSRLARTGVLKILSAVLTADREFRQRSSREADLDAGLSHPNIVSIHDPVEYRAQLWISMDYVQGTDAAELTRMAYARMCVELDPVYTAQLEYGEWSSRQPHHFGAAAVVTQQDPAARR